jgi:hypothetical protein
MPATKYKQFYQLMMNQHGKLFADFKPIHDHYQENPTDPKAAEAFHQEGRRVLDVARDWERRLCSGMERGKFSQYSVKLSEKFWDEIKKDLPLVEEIGVKTTHL